MIVFPNAKINIGLNIVSKRADGYHDLETIFFPVSIKDVLEVVEAKELTFTSSGLEIPGDSKNNICLKAYELFSKDLKLPPVHIHLHKNIPIGAGLGGGSANAAFLIKLMNDKFLLKLTIKQMEHYASQLGADCAFFIQNQPVFATGKGDKFETIELNLSKYFLVVVMPDVHVSTSGAFKDIHPKPAVTCLLDLINEDILNWKFSIINDFEPGMIERYPEIGAVKNYLYRAGAIFASMSGSGSSIYALFESPLKLPELEAGNRVFYGV